MKKPTLKQKVIRGFIYFLLICITINTLLPLYFVVIASFNPGNSLFSTKMFPETLTTKHYRSVREKDYAIWYMNTLKIALCSMVLTVILVIITSYVVPVSVQRPENRLDVHAGYDNVSGFYEHDCDIFITSAGRLVRYSPGINPGILRWQYCRVHMAC